MKHTSLIILLTALFVTGPIMSQNQIHYSKGETHSKHQLGISKFYFVHHLFADAFFMTDLYKQLSYDEMSEILKTVYYSISEDEKVLVEIVQPKGPNARLAFSFMGKTEKLGDILVLGTNFNKSTRVFEEETDENQSIYRWYKIKKDRIIYRKDIYSKEKEEQYKEKEKLYLIDLYLFDDNLKNDHKAQPLINASIASDRTNSEKVYGYLYQGECFQIEGRMEEAALALEHLRNLLNGDPQLLKDHSLILNMATTEYEIISRLID